jgi:hypothetical protein
VKDSGWFKSINFLKIIFVVGQDKKFVARDFARIAKAVMNSFGEFPAGQREFVLACVVEFDEFDGICGIRRVIKNLVDDNTSRRREGRRGEADRNETSDAHNLHFVQFLRWLRNAKEAGDFPPFFNTWWKELKLQNS